jgi:hypothetical protein
MVESVVLVLDPRGMAMGLLLPQSILPGLPRPHPPLLVVVVVVV